MRPEVFATDLVEANVGGLLTEALTADVQAVLADETGLVGADTAVVEKIHMLALRSLEYVLYCHFAFCMSFSIAFISPSIFLLGVNAPFAAALAVGARARVPDRLVRHIGD